MSRDFHDKAPELVQVFEQVELPLPIFNALLADMAQHHRNVADVRAKFFREHRALWSKWVTPQAVGRIDAALK